MSPWRELVATLDYLIHQITVATIQQTFEGENLHNFCNFCSTCFTLNSLLAIDIHYQKELLPRKFFCEHSFSILTAKVFPLNVLPYTACTLLSSIGHNLNLT